MSLGFDPAEARGVGWPGLEVEVGCLWQQKPLGGLQIDPKTQ